MCSRRTEALINYIASGIVIGAAIVLLVMAFYISAVKEKPQAEEVYTYNGLLQSEPEVYTGQSLSVYQKLHDGLVFEDRIYKTPGSKVNIYRVLKFDKWSGRADYIAWIEHSSGVNRPLFTNNLSYSSGIFAYNDRFEIPTGIPSGKYKLKSRLVIHHSVFSTYILNLSDIEFEIK